MKSSIQKISDSQIEIAIEVLAQEFQVFFDKALDVLGKEVEIEGFRKGKAPEEMVEKRLGEEKILNAAAEECIRENYLKAISENKIEPLGQPTVEILKLAKGNPFEFKAKVFILPEILLPDYRKIVPQIKRKEVEITEEEIKKMKEEKEKFEKERIRQEILEKIAEKTKIETPLILVESEKNRMLENLKQQVPQVLQMSFEDYLKKLKKTEQELLESFSQEAEKRVKNSIVLKEVEKKEEVKASEEELREEMDKISKIYQNLDQNQLKDYAEGVIKNEKTFQLLENLIK
ncbi:MAG: trigger factor [Candidatus Nealsonbacteria bacterium]